MILISITCQRKIPLKGILLVNNRLEKGVNFFGSSATLSPGDNLNSLSKERGCALEDLPGPILGLFGARWCGILLGGWDPRTSKRLGSPLFISHKKAIWRGITPFRGFTNRGY